MCGELDIIPKINIDHVVSLSELIRTEQNKDNWKLYFKVPDGEYALTLTFPKLGGVHVQGQVPGYFCDQGKETITYIQADGAETAKAANGISVHFYNNEKWKLVVCRKDGSAYFTLNADSLRLGYQGNNIKKIIYEREIQDGERLTGFGERYNTLNQVGRRLPLRNKDTGYHGQDASGEKSYAYKNVPLFHSSLGYSFFFDSFYSAVADMTLREQQALELNFNGPICDFYIWHGTISETLDSYTALTGRPYLPPKWAFRYWAGGSAGIWAARGNDRYLEVLQECLDGYTRLGTLPSALYGESLPSQKEDAYPLTEAAGVRMLCWNHPGVDMDIRGYSQEHIRDYLPGISDDELPIFHTDDPENPLDTSGWIDYSHPMAHDLMRKKYEKYWSWGLKGAMVDYGEYIEDSVHCYNGMTGEQMHNFYAYVYNKTLHDAWNESNGNDYVLFARAGCAGSQQWAASFGGDQASQFYGLRQALAGGLNAGVSGFSVWGSDIGGLCGEPTEELYIRWLQFAAFSPLMRTHGTSDHNPWTFGKRAESVFKKFYWIRENLLDYLYHSAVVSNHIGLPIMQMMTVAFPEQKPLVAIEDQYMLGTEILVCPVLNEGATSRIVALPEGKWIDFWTSKECTGGRVIEAQAPLEQCPLYLREGAVLPLRLASTLRLGDALDDSAVQDALLITPTTLRREHTVWFDSSHSSRFTIEATQTGCALQNSDAYHTRTIAVYGAKVTSAQVDERPVKDSITLDHETEKAYVTVLVLPDQPWKKLYINI